MENILTKYRKLPELIRLSITAIIGAFTGFITYEIIYYLNPLHPKASTSWFLAYIIGVARQHALHRWLTFNHKASYWKSLYKAYIMYSGSLLVSSALNWFLTEILYLNHRLAWACCLLTTALISLVFLKRYVFKTIG
jgi:putative flippase GtrA